MLNFFLQKWDLVLFTFICVKRGGNGKQKDRELVFCMLFLSHNIILEQDIKCFTSNISNSTFIYILATVHFSN